MSTAADSLLITDADMPPVSLRSLVTGSRVIKPSATPMDFAYQRTGTVIIELGKTGIQWDGGENIYEYPGETAVVQVVGRSDIPGALPPQVELLDPILSDFADPDEAKATATVATRMKEAAAIVIRTQEDLDDIGRRVIDNKKLQKHFQKIFNWKAIKQDMDAAKAKVLAQEHAVMDPLIAEERHYKTVIGTFEAEQRRIAEERARQEQVVREAEQKRLLAEAEQRRLEEQARINAALALEHAEEVERALVDAEQSGASQEEIAAICETPAPEPVIIPLDIPVLPAAPAAVVPAFTMPKGISSARKKKYVGRLVSIAQLCAAVASGKQPSTLVDANMRNINKIVDASGPAANIPGIRVEEDTSRLPSIRT